MGNTCCCGVCWKNRMSFITSGDIFKTSCAFRIIIRACGLRGCCKSGQLLMCAIQPSIWSNASTNELQETSTILKSVRWNNCGLKRVLSRTTYSLLRFLVLIERVWELQMMFVSVKQGNMPLYAIHRAVCTIFSFNHLLTDNIFSTVS